MTKPSDHDVQPRDPLVAEMFDTLDDTLKEAFLERASIIEFDSNLSRAHAECLAMICILTEWGCANSTTLYDQATQLRS